MMTTTDTPRVWIGCLGCYNGGDLVGEWFDAVDCPTEMPEWVNIVKLHADNPSTVMPEDHYRDDHEELWVFDHENFHGALTGECSPADAQRIGEGLMATADVTGAPLAAVGAYIENVGVRYVNWLTVADDFTDAYMGEYASGADYAQELADEIVGGDRFGQWPFSCIDWDRAWRELEMGDGMWTHPTGNGTVYVFRSL